LKHQGPAIETQPNHVKNFLYIVNNEYGDV
jgi:hypothetical protein